VYVIWKDIRDTQIGVAKPIVITYACRAKGKRNNPGGLRCAFKVMDIPRASVCMKPSSRATLGKENRKEGCISVVERAPKGVVS